MVRADTPAQLDELFASVRASGFRFLVQEYVPGGDDEIGSFHAYLDEGSTRRSATTSAGRFGRTREMRG